MSCISKFNLSNLHPSYQFSDIATFCYIFIIPNSAHIITNFYYSRIFKIEIYNVWLNERKHILYFLFFTLSDQSYIKYPTSITATLTSLVWMMSPWNVYIWYPVWWIYILIYHALTYLPTTVNTEEFSVITHGIWMRICFGSVLPWQIPPFHYFSQYRQNTHWLSHPLWIN